MAPAWNSCGIPTCRAISHRLAAGPGCRATVHGGLNFNGSCGWLSQWLQTNLDWEDLLQVLGITPTWLDLDSICFAIPKKVYLSLIGPFWVKSTNKEDFGRNKELLEKITVILRTNMVITGHYMNVNGTNIVIVGKLSTYWWKLRPSKELSGKTKWPKTAKRVISKKTEVLFTFKKVMGNILKWSGLFTC